MFIPIMSYKFYFNGKLISDDAFDERGDTPPFYINSDIIEQVHVLRCSEDLWGGFAELKNGKASEFLPLTKQRESRADILFELQLMMREINETDKARKVDSSSELKFA